VFNKPDSQEICFVPDNDYAGFIERKRPDLAAGARGEGKILDPQGQTVGSHGGQHRFTIGQRRGVGIALGYPIYVVGKDPEANTITVGPKEMLESIACIGGEANWLVDLPRTGESIRCMAQYRYNSEPVAATVSVLPDAPESQQTPSGRRGRFAVSFDAPQSAVTPGQAVVLYQGEVVLGGGWIESVQASR
jgi:tRNA-specific 2-thiouridylase